MSTRTEAELSCSSKNLNEFHHISTPGLRGHSHGFAREVCDQAMGSGFCNTVVEHDFDTSRILKPVKKKKIKREIRRGAKIFKTL